MLATLLLSITIGAGDAEQCPPLRPERLTYKDLVSRVMNGESIMISVGMDIPGCLRCDDALGREHGKDDTITKGQYLCWLDGAGPNKRPLMKRNSSTPTYDPATRYYTPVWNRTCPDGKCQNK